MKETINIYGVDILLPEAPPSENIHGHEFPKDEQFWRRIELPDFFETVSYNKDGDLILTPQQKQFADEEVRKCRQGFWFYNHGKQTWITGKYYFFLQWWKLEDDIYADYRDADRRWYLYLNHWENIKWCLGVVRGKHRRAGASSQACANLMYECIFYQNSKCGLISKSKDDSRDTFTDMVGFGYKKLPAFLQPKQLNSKDSVSEYVFAQKSSAIKEGVTNVIQNNQGNQSKINYRAPVLNAYDRGKISRILLDEFGKLEKDVPASKLFSIIKETLVKGIKRVGFCEMPSTVNELTKSGGAEYKIIWDNAKKLKRNGRVTVNGLKTYFNAAYDGLEGFIDKYGRSVISAPDEETYAWLIKKWVKYDEDTGELTSEVSEEDIKLGAKEYLITTRDGLEGDLLEEQIRKYPFDEEEMFMYAGIGCEFNAINIKKQLQDLEINPVFVRQVRLPKKVETIKSDILGAKEKIKKSISFMDDEKGGWLLFEKPIKENNFRDSGGRLEPLNTHIYQIGVDTTKDDFALHGSKPTICVFKKSLIIEGEETGMKPVALYVDKTRLDVHFDNEVLKACMWYGCTANYEIDARTDFYKYFWKEGANKMLEWTPKFAQDPVKFTPAKYKPGTQSADPYQLSAQLQAAKMYIDGTNPETYNGHVHRIVFPTLLNQLLKYDHSNRTPSDQVIAMMMALLPVLGESEVPKKSETRPKSVLAQYKIKMPV